MVSSCIYLNHIFTTTTLPVELQTAIMAVNPIQSLVDSIYTGSASVACQKALSAFVEHGLSITVG